MATALMMVALAAAPAAPTMFVQDLTGVDVERAELAWVTDQLAQALSERGVKVTTSSQVVSVVGLERQRELLGCANDGCLAELGQALGVEVLVLGSLARLSGAEVRLSVRTISATSGAVLRAFSENADGRAALVDAVGRAAAMLAPGPSSAGSFRPPLIPLVAGGVGLAAGLAALVGAQLVADEMKRVALRPQDPLPTLRSLVTTGTVLEVAGVGVVVAGALSLSLSLVLGALLPAAEPVTP